MGLWEGEESVSEKQDERVAHTIVLGTTRVGKTRLAEVRIAQDIHNGDVVIVFGPKGDGDLLKRTDIEAVKAGRAHKFYCFHLGYPELTPSVHLVVSPSLHRVLPASCQVRARVLPFANSRGVMST